MLGITLALGMQAQIHYPLLDMSGIPLFLDKLAGEHLLAQMRTLPLKSVRSE